MQRQAVRHQAGACQAHRSVRQPFREQFRAREHKRRRAVRQGRHIIQVERTGHRSGFEIAFGFDSFGVHGMRVIDRVGMRDDRESRQSLAREMVFVQIALHEQGSLTNRGLPLIRFKIRVQVARAERFNVAAKHIRGFFHADSRRDVHHPGSNRQIRHAQRGSAGGVCRFNRAALRAA